MYNVNELGTEGFVPLTPGRVLSTSDMRKMGGGGAAVNFAPVTQVAAGVTAPELRAIIEQGPCVVMVAKDDMLALLTRARTADTLAAENVRLRAQIAATEEPEDGAGLAERGA
jgi:hypothetical protein